MSEPIALDAPRADTLDLALAYAEAGWPVFPCDPLSKRPLAVTGFKSASKSPAEITKLWRRRPDAMVAIPTGEASGVFVVDLDRDDAKGLDGAAEIARLGDLPRTISQRTPRGGRHAFLRWNPDRPVRNSAGTIARGVDVRGEGGYVVVSGSVRADGARYEWETPPEAMEPAEAPEWLYEAMSRQQPEPAPAPTRPPYKPLATQGGAYADAALAEECQRVASAPAGQRNDALNRAAFSLGQLVGGGELAEAVVRAELERAAEASGLLADDGAGAVRATMESGLAAGRQTPRAKPEPTRVEPIVLRSAREVVDPTTGEVTLEGPPPGLDLNAWRSSRFVGEPPEIQWLIRDAIPMGIPAMVAAAGDVGKSMLLLEAGRRIAFGCSPISPPIFGGDVAREGSVVIITAEDDAASIHRRLASLDDRQARFTARGERLIIVPLPDAGGPFAIVRQTHDGLEVTDDFKRLEDQLAGIPDLALMVFDPLQAFVHAPINEDPAAGQFVCSLLARLAAGTGATTLAAHHMRKPGRGGIHTLQDAREAVRGTTALVDGLRLAYALWPTEEKEARAICKELNRTYQPNAIVKGGVIKANGPSKRSVATYVRNDNGLLVDHSALLAGGRAPHRESLETLVAAVGQAAEAGQPFTKTGANGVYELRHRLPASLRTISRDKLQGLAQEALDGAMITQALASGTTVKWLDVPGGRFALGLGEFTQGATSQAQA